MRTAAHSCKRCGAQVSEAGRSCSSCSRTRPKARIIDQTWRERAACDGADVEAFYPARRDRVDQRAITTCRTCPVAADCLDVAMRDETGLPGDYRYGIWGGLTPDERAALDDTRTDLEQVG